MADITQEELELIMNNPTRVINTVISRIENGYSKNGMRLNSKSHPFVFCLDLACATQVAQLNRNADAVSQVYKVHARNMDELSRNMSDAEWWGMFGEPSSTLLQFAISLNDIKTLGKEYISYNGQVKVVYTKLVIPKDTEIDVLGIRFSIENAIEIRAMPDGNIQALYDNTIISPFNAISSNVLETEIVNKNGQSFLYITIPVRQVKLDVLTNISSTIAGGLKDTYNYDDYLYAIRAFITDNRTNTSKEMKIVYNGQVFDPGQPTLCINLDTSRNLFTYEIPQVYLNNGLGVGRVALYVYTTKGKLEKDLGSISEKNFQPLYRKYVVNSDALDQYEAPMKSVINSAWYSLTGISGGADPRTFNEIKAASITSSNTINVPITDNQITDRLGRFGYRAVKTVDLVFKRLYSVSRELPEQSNKGFTSSVSTCINSHRASINQLVASKVVYDNGERITIPSNTIFDITDGYSKLLSKSDVDAIAKMTNEQKMQLISSNSLIYTPFYYIVDSAIRNPNIRCYDLDDPIVDAQVFRYEKTSLGMELGVKQISIIAVNNGYRITLAVRSSDNYKQLGDDAVGAQLSFVPVNSDSLASIKGKIIGLDQDNERVWQFDINCNFDVDFSDNIYLNNFSQFGFAQKALPAKLSERMTMVFTMAGGRDQSTSDSDSKIEQELFDTNMIAIIETGYRITFGKALNNMFTRIRPLAGEAKYQRYLTNVQSTFQDDVWRREPNGDLYIDPTTHLPVIVHRKGDPEVNASGQPVWAHIKNDFIKDANGNNIELEPRELDYHYDVIGFDIAYLLSTDEYDLQYVADVKRYLTDTVYKDLVAFRSACIEETVMLFKPLTKLSTIPVVINSDLNTTMRSDLTFSVKYYLTEDNYKDFNLKAALIKNTPIALNRVIKNTTISVDMILEELRKLGGTDIEGVSLDKFTDRTGVEIISSKENDCSFSIRKLFENTSDNILTIKEAVDVTFDIHKKKEQ